MNVKIKDEDEQTKSNMNLLSEFVTLCFLRFILRAAAFISLFRVLSDLKTFLPPSLLPYFNEFEERGNFVVASYQNNSKEKK
jgi:hypothetical protein